MGIFKSKAEKEIEKKMLIKKTVSDMRKHIQKLESQKNSYLTKAREAKQKGLSAQVNLAKSGLRMSLMQLKRAQEMLLNFEITSQMKDMSLMTKDFLKGMEVLSAEMIRLTNSKDFVQVQKSFMTAMQSAEMQSEKLDMFLDMSEESFGNGSEEQADSIDDDLLDRLIDNSVAASESSSTDELEEILKLLNVKEQS